MRAARRAIAAVVALAALSLLAFGGGCQKACDPGDLINACGSDAVCDAASRTCVDETPCASSAECSDGYVCYSEGHCARNCYSGFFPFDYCVADFVCDRATYECRPGAP